MMPSIAPSESSTMNQHPLEDLIRFLKETDRQLSTYHGVIIIGGAAALLGHAAARPTTDIDSITRIPKELEEAFARAREITGLDIPVTKVGVFDGPYEFETRLDTLELGLTRLTIQVPERHDLVLMKVVRGYEHDIQVIAQMHLSSPLDKAILIHRYKQEMTHVIGQPEVLRLSFLLMMQTLFGEDVAQRIELEL